MADPATKLPSVQQHADSIMDKIIQERGGIEDTESARLAAAVPTFSSGTAALNRDGKPVIPKKQAETPEFTEGPGVAIPEGTEKVAAPEAPASKEAILAAHAARLEEVAPPAESVAGQEAGAQAADAAAEAVADVFAEYDEFEFDDPDLDVKIPVRVPKQYSETAKRGYGRRAALDRAIRYAKDADPVLRGLIENGQMAQLLPIIQWALNDPAAGEYVSQGYNRSRQGLPLIEQAKMEAAAAAAPQQTPLPDIDDDPFFAERLAPIRREIEEVRSWKAQQEQERQAAQQRQQEQQRQNMIRANQMKGAHEDLSRAYPELFNASLGTNDPNWQRALTQAREARYTDTYDLRAAIFFGGQLVSQMEAEKVAMTGSTAAAALQQMEQKHLGLARQEAANASRAVGTGAAMRAAPPPPPQRPSTTLPDGRMKPSAQYMQEMAQYIEASNQAASAR